MLSYRLLRRPVRYYLPKAWKFIHQEFFLVLPEWIMAIIAVYFRIGSILRRQKLMTSISPFWALLTLHMLFKIFMRCKIVISMWVIYILIMLINKYIHFLRLHYIFFKDNISRVIISDSSFTLLIIIHKIHSLCTIVRYCLLWLVFNKRTT